MPVFTTLDAFLDANVSLSPALQDMTQQLTDMIAVARSTAITRQQATKLGDLPRINGEASAPNNTNDFFVSDVDPLADPDIFFREDTDASTVDLVSTSTDDDDGGVGATHVMVRGLDDDFLLQDEVVTLDGTTTVTTTAEFIRVHEILVYTAGSYLATNVGTITAEFTEDTGTVVARIQAAMGRSKVGHYTVPDDMALAMTGIDLWAKYTTSPGPDISARVSVYPWIMFGDDGLRLVSTAEHYGGAFDLFAGAGAGRISHRPAVPWVLGRRSMIVCTAALASADTGITVYSELPALANQLAYPAYVAP